ncbi:MAG TPA: Crp/Fnr family transcriptional regulator [Armatimonadota bacterium]|nr:Crp/Fnr family transcriptional regulator [Armatimonadota bacterium]
MATKDLLADIPLFEGLSDADLAIIAQRVRQPRYKEGHTIFHRDEPGVALYIIVSGKVKIHNETSDGADCIIAILSEGDFFGDQAVIDGEARSADATTLEPTELLMLTRDDLHDILERYPRISLHLLVTLAGRLRRTTEVYQAYSSLDVNGRLALQFLRLSEQHGIVTPAGVRIDLRLTQTDLGALVGASRESVNKVMGYFRRQGYVTVDDRNQITVRDQAALARICEMRL